MRTARWTIAMMTALVLTGAACSNGGSSTGSGGGLYGGGSSPFFSFRLLLKAAMNAFPLGPSFSSGRPA